MLPEIGATELMVIAAVALIVVGPKDLPVLLRKLGAFVARLRGMANEFRTSFDDMARQSELDDLRREVAAMRDVAAAENAAVNSQIEALNHDTALNLAGETPPAPSYAEPDAAAAPAAVEAAPKPAKAKAAKAKPAATKAKAKAAEAPKPAAKPAKPRAPRKAAT